MIEITIDDPRWDVIFPKAEKEIRQLSKVTMEYVNIHKLNCTISYLLSNDAKLQELNFLYLGKNSPTNVLSFPSESKIKRNCILGDIAISIDRIVEESEQYNIPLMDHLSHMVVHGILHLLGHDHIEEEERIAMEFIEVNVLQKLSIPNPYDE